MSLGLNILIYREKKRLTQEQLADLIEVTRQTVSLWESDAMQPSRAKLQKLAKALGVTVAQLYSDDVDSNLTSERKAVMETVQAPSHNGRHPIPFFDTIAVGGTGVLADQSAVREPSDMIYPGSLLATATGALRIYGHSMFPKYPAGCVVAYRDADKDVIIWGEDYVIELTDRRLIKRLEKSAREGCVSAVSYNKSEDYVYAPIDIPLLKIKRLYMVVGKVELEASI